jgi:hypothetical protein
MCCHCNVIPASFIKKPRGGSSLGSLCGGSRCCLYSTKERGGCGILICVFIFEESDVMPILINEELFPLQKIYIYHFNDPFFSRKMHPSLFFKTKKSKKNKKMKKKYVGVAEPPHRLDFFF